MIDRTPSLAAALDLRRRRSVNHVGIVGSDLLVQTLRRVRQQVPVLMNSAPLYRHAIPDGGDGLLQSLPAIHDQQLGAARAAADHIIKDAAPRLPCSPHPCS